MSRFVALGGERLGPTNKGPNGTSFATLRDPFGSVIGFLQNAMLPRRTPVAWHQLHTRDLEAAWALYSELLDWEPMSSIEVPDLEGGIRTFAWDRSSPEVGSVANTARLPGVHPHWLFYFPVADLDASLALVHAKGGSPIASPIVLPNGTRLAPCHDPQGAAFGLFAANGTARDT